MVISSMFSSGHRTLYIGVHVPLGRRSHRRHRHHGHRHRKRSKERDSSADDGRESPSHSRCTRWAESNSEMLLKKMAFSYSIACWFSFSPPSSFCPPPVPFAAVDTPAQRVQFLLGTEDGDEEHMPHALFTELDEICLREGEDAEWRETARYTAPARCFFSPSWTRDLVSAVGLRAADAFGVFCIFRWLKFEEDVEDGGERWSKPYVATLSLHSLFELRSCIMNGTVMLDMRANSLEEIAGRKVYISL